MRTQTHARTRLARKRCAVAYLAVAEAAREAAEDATAVATAAAIAAALPAATPAAAGASASPEVARLERELEAWLLQELSRLKDKENLRSPVATRSAILRKEQEVLGRIERLRVMAFEERHARHVGNQLEDMSAPRRWRLRNGEVMEVHTPLTTRADELRNMYKAPPSRPNPTYPEISLPYSPPPTLLPP